MVKIVKQTLIQQASLVLWLKRIQNLSPLLSPEKSMDWKDLKLLNIIGDDNTIDIFELLTCDEGVLYLFINITPKTLWMWKKEILKSKMFPYVKQELKALLDPEFSNITTFLELFGW